MLKRLRIRNYQSHVDTDIELGNFTVLEGQSSSGKSAVVRALNALSSNQTGKDFITHGATTCQISAETDKGTLVLTKGKPEDSYVILEEGSDTPKKFTKLGGGVPQDVSDFLGIAPKDPINFAGQFDMPFLLRSSASEVARVLGELTNVSVIFEASRQALTKRNAFNQKYKVREGDIERLKAQETNFAGLEEQDAALDKAELFIAEAKQKSKVLSDIQDAVRTVSVARARLQAAQAKTETPLPDIQPIVELLKQKKEIETLTATMSRSAATKREALARIAQAEEAIASLEAEYEQVLREAGTCPTCQQEIAA